MKLPLLFCLLFTLCAAVVAQPPSPSNPGAAQLVVPRLIRFSGQLDKPAGVIGITFSLHKSQHDNAALWIETQNVKVDAKGKYSVLLGATKPEGLPAELFTSGEAQWLAIHVDGQAEQPRVLLVSVPYALKAAEAETLDGHSAAEFVTTEKLSDAVAQQIQKPTSTAATTRLKSNAVSAGATNFSASTTDQVVKVTQSGTGSALSATAAGNAIQGTSTTTTAANYGVLGSSASSGGFGVIGNNTSATGSAVGVKGGTSSKAGIAMEANATSTTGATQGMRAIAASPTGTAGVFVNSAEGKVISGVSGPSPSEVFEVFSVDGYGRIRATTADLSEGDGNYQITAAGGIGVLGVDSLHSNLFVGYENGQKDTPTSDGTDGGDFNTFVGTFSGVSNKTGGSNTFVGSIAGEHDVSGDNNTFVGAQAGNSATGNFNTYVGSGSGRNNTSGHNNIYLLNPGCPFPCTESNTIRIGSDVGYGEQTATYIKGIYGAATSGSAVYVRSDGKLGTSTSSRRFKENITPVGDRTSKLFQLQPVAFFYKSEYDDGSHQLQYGLIAEDVAKIYPELVIYDKDGQPYSVKYQFLAPMLLNALQNEHRVVTAQQRVIRSQQQNMKQQQREIEDLRNRMSRLEAAVVPRSH